MPHERLLLKLKCHGIDGSLLRWFRSFFTERKKRIVVRGTHSSWPCVMSRVPQGTILGPMLFVIYVNYMSSNVSQHSHLRLVYFTAFLSYDILSKKILYQAAVDIKSCVYNAVDISLYTFKDKTSTLLKK